MIDEKDKKIFELQTKIGKLETELYETKQRLKDYQQVAEDFKNNYHEIYDFLDKNHSTALSHFFHEKSLTGD